MLIVIVRAPNYYAHGIYKDLPGAENTEKLDPTGQTVWYSVPCNTKLNLTLSFRCVLDGLRTDRRDHADNQVPHAPHRCYPGGHR